MSSLRDFVRSATSDTMLPVFRQTLEDVVMEVLSERQVPSRTDFHEFRDLVNSMRSSVSSTANAMQAIDQRVQALEERIAALESAAAKKPARPRKKKPAATAKKKSGR
ncbi:MAG: hypothetical protein VX519_01215 [Myxococcota bacterium]|nr:hypothetical protein [Myxococcota bacterium]